MNNIRLYFILGLLVVYILYIDLSVIWPAIILSILAITQNKWDSLIYCADELFDMDVSDEDDVVNIGEECGHDVLFISQIIGIVIAVAFLKLMKYMVLTIMG